ncbi:formyl transferase [Pseudobutyrivibrio xylanivorans]|uniref:Formyl transferase n=2 Tax=Pseudobutyrivibrio xylanivorans TaxID=185007 RepID=A0A5P6VV00_PSEXY|nr:formyl transferase [Pseudobutyrivibrio xylanivorans]
MLENGYIVDGIITMESSAINADFRSLVPLAEKYGIDCICTKNINDEETVGFVRDKAPEVIYCFGWSRLIGKELLSIPKYGVIGFHPAAIPFNKGRHPIIWALVLGLEKTASSFFVMDEGADTGDIISQKEIIIDETDDAQSLYDKILETAKVQVLEFTKQFAEDSVVRHPQDLNAGNTWRKRGRLDGQIDFRMSCKAIYNLVRGLSHPYPGAHIAVGERDVKVWKCEYIISDEFTNLEPGKVLEVNSPTDYVVKAYDGTIHVLDGDPMDIKEGDYL